MWVKICGIRDPEAAQAVSALRPDAIGLNFYRRSVRGVPVERAAEIAEVLPADVAAVGVFVNPTMDELRDALRACRLDAIQLHGDESAEAVAGIQRVFPTVRILRAFRIGAEGLDPVARDIEACRREGVELAACLADASVPGTYGGTGCEVDRAALAGNWPKDWPPLVLAGGLRCENVARAIREVRPWGVDVASGVESAPGVKDLELVARFIREAREADSGRTTKLLER